METLTVEELVNKARVGGVYRLEGWLYNRGSIDDGVRLTIRDITGLITCDVDVDDVDENTIVKAGGVDRHSRLTLEGRLTADDETEANRIFRVTDITVDNESDTYQKAEEGFAADVDRFWIEPERMTRTSTLYSTVRTALEDTMRDQSSYIALPPDDGHPTYPWGYLEAAIHGLGAVYTERQYPSHRWFMQTRDESLDALVQRQQDILSQVVRTVCDEASAVLSYLNRNPESLQRKTADVQQETPSSLDHWTADDPTAISSHLSLPTIVTEQQGGAPYIKQDDEQVYRATMYAPGGHGKLMDGFILEKDPMNVMKRIQARDELPEKYRRLIESKRHGNVTTTSYTIDLETLTSWLAGTSVEDVVLFRD